MGVNKKLIDNNNFFNDIYSIIHNTLKYFFINLRNLFFRAPSSSASSVESALDFEERRIYVEEDERFEDVKFPPTGDFTLSPTSEANTFAYGFQMMKESEFDSFFDKDGRLIDEPKLRQTIFKGESDLLILLLLIW